MRNTEHYHERESKMNKMEGINISQRRAENLKEFSIYLDRETGFWIATEGLGKVDYTYRVYRTGDKVDTIPDAAEKL